MRKLIKKNPKNQIWKAIVYGFNHNCDIQNQASTNGLYGLPCVSKN